MDIKRLSCILITAAMLTACGSKGEGASAAAPDTASSPTETTAAETEVTEEIKVAKIKDELSPYIPELSLERFEIPENEGLEFVKNLKLGWNLGNTFDANNCGHLQDELEYESAWCGAMTTRGHIRSVKEAGFNAVRIPVSWHDHVSDDGEYTISEPWLGRVAEVVDWCMDEELYVILNIHHDNSRAFFYPKEGDYNNSEKYITSIWKQLSERFRDYDEKLIFDTMNEPRLVGHTNEWWIEPNKPACIEAIDCISRFNQAAVDTIRASGGNNETRWILCPGYDASPEGALNAGYVIPSDPANRIIISVHAYTPYNFALQDEKSGVSEWSSENPADVAAMTGFMDRLYEKYVSQGIPVLIDEFGARKKGDNLASRVDFASYYVAAARARGMTCFWWDNNAFMGDGELFGLLDRNHNIWIYPDIVQGMVKYAS